MQKTTNYNLNKPEAGDALRVEDFNQNADIIDAALGQILSLARVEQVKVGSFKGTGDSGRTVELGFTPKAIILMSQGNSAGNVSFHFATADFGCSLTTTIISTSKTRCVAGGVYLADSTNNSEPYPNHYIAFV